MLDFLPINPAHLVLYGLAGDLTPAQARLLWRPFLDLVERVQAGEDVSQPPKGTRRTAKARRGGAR